MKKTSKIFGTLALSAALAFGCALPAFAVTPDAPEIADENEGNYTQTGTIKDDDTMDATNQTTVSLTTYTSQLSVTVPIALPIVANTGGGDALTPNNYYIKNNSVPNILIDDANWNIVTGQDQAWNLGTGEFADGASPEAINYATGNSPTMPTKGSLYMKLTPGTYDEGASSWTQASGMESLEVIGTNGSKNKDSSKGSTEGLNWAIKGSGTSTGATEDAKEAEQTQAIRVEASSSMIASETPDATNVIQIKYIVKLDAQKPTTVEP